MSSPNGSDRGPPRPAKGVRFQPPRSVLGGFFGAKTSDPWRIHRSTIHCANELPMQLLFNSGETSILPFWGTFLVPFSIGNVYFSFTTLHQPQLPSDF